LILTYLLGEGEKETELRTQGKKTKTKNKGNRKTIKEQKTAGRFSNK